VCECSGTAEANIDSIVRNNFDLKKVGASTGNMGYYGKGIYFSEFPGYSMPYVRGGTRIMLCQIILGKCYRISYKMGASLQPGYDSHISTGSSFSISYSSFPQCKVVDVIFFGLVWFFFFFFSVQMETKLSSSIQMPFFLATLYTTKLKEVEELRLVGESGQFSCCKPSKKTTEYIAHIFVQFLHKILSN
jgi:hypothetical protein